MKNFCICHRCCWHRWQTLSCKYLREFLKKLETAIIVYSGAWGKVVHEKKQKSKISWHCPFNLLFSLLFILWIAPRNSDSDLSTESTDLGFETLTQTSAQKRRTGFWNSDTDLNTESTDLGFETLTHRPQHNFDVFRFWNSDTDFSTELTDLRFETLTQTSAQNQRLRFWNSDTDLSTESTDLGFETLTQTSAQNPRIYRFWNSDTDLSTESTDLHY